MTCPYGPHPTSAEARLCPHLVCTTVKGRVLTPTWGCLACQGHKTVHAANCPNSTEGVRPTRIRCSHSTALAVRYRPAYREAVRRGIERNDDLRAALAPTASVAELDADVQLASARPLNLAVLHTALDFASEDSGNWAASVSRDYRDGFRAALRCAIEALSAPAHPALDPEVSTPARVSSATDGAT